VNGTEFMKCIPGDTDTVMCKNCVPQWVSVTKSYYNFPSLPNGRALPTAQLISKITALGISR
jgi:hypothetical protein